MWFVLLLVRASMTDASSCEVKVNTTTKYISKEACTAEMTGMAKYAASCLGLTTRPYCFPLDKTI